MFNRKPTAKSLVDEHKDILAQLLNLKVRARESRSGLQSQLQTLAIELAAHDDLISKL